MSKQIEQSPEPQIQSLTPAQWANGRRLLFKNELVKRIDTIKELLPTQIQAQKFIQVIANTCINNPRLLECTPQSLISAALKCAQLGLMPDSYTGEAHLIPFKNNSKGGIQEVQFIPGYRGLVQLAIRSGQVKRFQARAVFAEDEFMYSLGTEEYIKHVPAAKSAEITHFYAVIEFINGGLMFEVMRKEQVDQVRDASPNYSYADRKEFTIWGKHYEEMGKKTVIRRLSKYAPISAEFQTAVSLDEQVEVIGEGQTIDIEFDELTQEEQLQVMNDLIEKDKQKKEENLHKPKDNKSRADAAATHAEKLINSKK